MREQHDIAPKDRYRFSLLGLAWLAYVAFTILGYPYCGISVMLSSILLCGLATWLYSYKMGLLTSLLSHPYNVLMMMYNLESLDGWKPALNIGGLLTQLLAIGCIGVLTVNRKKISQLNLELKKRVQERTDELNDLNEFLIHQDESEKNHLADNLYNEAASNLSALLMECDTLRDQLLAADHPQAEAAVKLAQLANMNITLIKNLTHHLSPARLDTLGIEQAIQDLVGYFQETMQTTFSVSISPQHRELHPATATNLYRITHEVVTNALRHGKAVHIDITLQLDAKNFTLMVTNDGTALPNPLIEGTGIHLIRQRARKINATVLYRRAYNGRTRFECISKSQTGME